MDNISKVIDTYEGYNKRDEREEHNHLDFRIFYNVKYYFIKNTIYTKIKNVRMHLIPIKI